MIKRVRADIADLQLNQITEIQPIKHKVGIAKHLCGTATGIHIFVTIDEVSFSFYILIDNNDAHFRFGDTLLGKVDERRT